MYVLQSLKKMGPTKCSNYLTMSILNIFRLRNISIIGFKCTELKFSSSMAFFKTVDCSLLHCILNFLPLKS